MDDHIIDFALESINSNFFDFMHGGLGAAFFFLERDLNEKNKKFLVEFLNKLYHHAEIENDKMTWSKNFFKNDDRKTYDLGLSHGISAIIIFLAKLIIAGIEIELSKKMLLGVVTWILGQKLKSQRSIFPYSVVEGIEPTPSRLGWCYGDLSVAISLWHASIALKDQKLKSESIGLLLHSSKRRNLIRDNVNDSSFCHGTSGIGYIFNKFYQRTKISTFRDVTNFWLRKTFEQGRHEDGIAGYKYYRPERYGGSSNQFGLMTGPAGIGLFLISVLDPSLMDWDAFLLI